MSDDTIQTEQEFQEFRKTHRNIDIFSYRCQACGNVISVKNHNREHLPVHCRQCANKKEKSEIPLFVSSVADLESFRKSHVQEQTITYVCPACGGLGKKNLRAARSYPLYCKTCSMKRTNLRKFGDESPQNGQNVQANRGRESLRLRSESYIRIATPEDYEKLKLCYERNQRVEQVCSVCGSLKKTVLKRVKFPCVCRGCGIKSTNIKRYGCACPCDVGEAKEKARKTMLDRYGVSSCRMAQYLFESNRFDSSWELSLWIYCRDHGIPIDHEPVRFSYIYEGISHWYYPDFRVDGRLVEVKGEQFFNEDGTMCNPYDHSDDGLFEAKHQCGMANGVVILREKDLKHVFAYMESAYPKGYLDGFRLDNAS